MASEQKLDPKAMIKLISDVLGIEKRYAHELKGVRDQRRKEIRELINKVVAERLQK